MYVKSKETTHLASYTQVDKSDLQVYPYFRLANLCICKPS